MQYTTREMNRRQLLGRFLIRKNMTHEHNAVHAELKEFEEFKELVKRMRDAQETFQNAISSEDIDQIDMCQFRMLDLEREVDEYLKKIE